jgi:NarL family two-component system response regulator LiaR
LHPIRILIVKHHNRLVSGLITALTIHPDIDLVGTASNGVEAIARCQQLNPDVVLIELVMPERDGASAIQEIHRRQPHIQIITLSKFAEESLVRQARQAGAVGNVQLGDSADSIVATIRNVYVTPTREQQSQDIQNIGDTKSSSR